MPAQLLSAHAPARSPPPAAGCSSPGSEDNGPRAVELLRDQYFPRCAAACLCRHLPLLPLIFPLICLGCPPPRPDGTAAAAPLSPLLQAEAPGARLRAAGAQDAAAAAGAGAAAGARAAAPALAQHAARRRLERHPQGQRLWWVARLVRAPGEGGDAAAACRALRWLTRLPPAAPPVLPLPADKHSEGSTSGGNGGRSGQAVAGAVKSLLRGLATVGLVAAAGVAAAVVGGARCSLLAGCAGGCSLLHRQQAAACCQCAGTQLWPLRTPNARPPARRTGDRLGGRQPRRRQAQERRRRQAPHDAAPRPAFGRDGPRPAPHAALPRARHPHRARLRPQQGAACIPAQSTVHAHRVGSLCERAPGEACVGSVSIIRDCRSRRWRGRAPAELLM
jgi:hypothetical protein